MIRCQLFKKVLKITMIIFCFCFLTSCKFVFNLLIILIFFIYYSESLASTFTKVIKINELTSGNQEILNLINRPELSVTISKIHAWQLTDYEKCVFLDADCLVVKPIDELFEKEELRYYFIDL